LANNNSFFSRLTRLFRSGPSIQRRVKGYDYRSYYDSDIIRGNYGYRAPFPFGRESSPFSVLGAYGILDRMARYSEFAEMEWCLHGDTKIAVPGGYKTIKELAQEYGTEKEFVVFSYDHAKKKIVPAVGKQARLTRHDHAYRVIFDSGKELIGTAEHRLLKRDGTYSTIAELRPGDAMMPFYRRLIDDHTESDRTESHKRQVIYNLSKEEGKYGWVAEHQLLAEFVLGRKLRPDEVVHHKNFIISDNRIENIEVLTEKEHRHLLDSALSDRKRDVVSNPRCIDNFKKNHYKWMKKNSLYEKRDVTFAKILQWCDTNSFNLYRVAKAFDVCDETIVARLRANGFSGFADFAKAYQPSWHSESWTNKSNKNSRRFGKDITFQSICNAFVKGMSKKQLAKTLGCSVLPIEKRLKEEGYATWEEFASSYESHKVIRVEYYGYIPLYDLTVDGYKNFATDSVISHNTPEIAAALNIFADETVAGDEKGKALHLYSKNPEVKKALEDLFYDILNIDFNLRPWVRNLVKYGDFFLYNEIVPDIGIVNVQPIPVNELEREEGFDPEDPYAVRYKWLTRGMRYLENWQITHMRILGNDLFLPYGTSILEPARRIWRQLLMAEDSMLVYRVVRSPERRVFYIDVGNIAPNDVPAYMEAVKQTLRSRDVIDRTTGRIDQRYNPVSIGDDYFLPVRGTQTGTKIDTLAGGQNATAVDDVKYLQQKLFAAIQVPKPYLNFDENLSAKASLAQQDIRFSRTISILQRVVISELNKMAMIHLYSKGFDGEDLINFELRLSNPSTVAMQQKLEAISTKFDIAGTAKETKLVDEEWIQRNILELTEDEIIKIEAGRRRDKIREVEIEATAVAENLPKPNATVDPFDPSNYQMSGAGVVKNPPVTDQSLNAPIISSNTNSNTQSSQSSIGNLNAFVASPSASIPTSQSSTSAPITPTPFLNRSKEKRKRRVRLAGRSNLAMPDFASMVSSKSRSLTDVYDSETINLKSPLSEESDLEIKNPPFLPSEIRSIFKKLDVHFETMGTQRKLLRELKEELATIDVELTNDVKDEIPADPQGDDEQLGDDQFEKLSNDIANDIDYEDMLLLESLTAETAEEGPSKKTKKQKTQEEKNQDLEQDRIIDVDLTTLD
jgi:hypothetical protein